MGRSSNHSGGSNPDPIQAKLAALEQELEQKYGFSSTQAQNQNQNNSPDPSATPSQGRSQGASKNKSQNFNVSIARWVAAILLLGVPLGAGLIWVANLPYPMVRKPVSKVAPLLLLPSYLKMDRGYREAIRYTEQSDQLINQATSPADIGLGAEKVELAQNALDDLPVWFLGYQPEYYCRWFDCQWRFTVDEFEQARKTIGRLEAQVFQESNAQTQLNQIEQELTRAKQQFQIAPDLAAKQQAIASWQTAIDQLAAVPRETLAGTLAEQQLKTNERDFTNLTGGISQRAGGNNLIAAAMQFAMQAAQTSQNPPHSALQWQQIKTLWQEAIDRLKQVQADNPAYLEAQKKLAEYQANLGTVQTRLQMEQEAADALQSAKGDIADLQRFTETESSNLGEYNRKLRQIMNQLETIQPGTTAYGEAQQLLQFARKRL